MKKIFLLISLFFLILSLTPVFTNAAIVPCGNPGQAQCTITDFFVMLNNIYNFIVWNIAAPLAILGLTIGGIFMMISAGNPQLLGTGKNILKMAIIGLVLVFCSWIIVNTILTALGYKGNWSVL